MVNLWFQVEWVRNEEIQIFVIMTEAIHVRNIFYGDLNSIEVRRVI